MLHSLGHQLEQEVSGEMSTVVERNAEKVLAYRGWQHHHSMESCDLEFFDPSLVRVFAAVVPTLVKWVSP